jgi:hypothetical protein
MSKGISADEAGHGDILDWLHRQGKQRDENVPEFDVEKTLRLVRAARDASTRDAEAANFWNVLTPAEQGDLVAAARRRTFPAGTALMREGEHADCVMVILDGRTKVILEENGGERVIAERGPGDVVGERGTAPGGVRSATVIAIEPVLTLVVTTADFAVFADEHPDLPDIVKQQSYDRLPAGRSSRLRSREDLGIRPEHAMQDGNAWAGGAHVEHGGPGDGLHRPGRPRAAAVLHSDEPAQFFLDPGLGAEGHTQAVRGLGALGHGPGDEPLPAGGLRRQAGGRKGTGDWHGAAGQVGGGLWCRHDRHRGC